MDMLHGPTRLPLLLIAVLTACGQGDGRATPGDVESPAGAVAELGVQNVAAPLPNVVTTAQPSRDQVADMMAMGYRHFVSLQVEQEPGAGWEEEGVPGAGGRFSRVPIAGPDDLTRENVEKLAAILEEIGGDRTVLYCASSNRVGALLALKAYWIDGAKAEDALALGREAGLRGLEPSVLSLLEEDR
jgi:protein tyrosine phosphatase (PTP) superfamily phosphohydrolase (DUF442 family)